MNPGAAGLEDCKSLITHLKKKKMIAEKYPVRRFLSIQQYLEDGELENAYWPPGSGNPADGSYRCAERQGSFRCAGATGCFSPLETPGIGLLQSWAPAKSQGRGLEGVSGTCEAPEFIAHARIQVWTDGRRGWIAHVTFLCCGIVLICVTLSPRLRFLYFAVLFWNSVGRNFELINIGG